MKPLCSIVVLLIIAGISLGAQESGDYYATGNKMFREGDYESAINFYTKAIQLDPRNGNYYASMGAAYGKLGKYEEGIKELKRAVSVNPSIEEPYYLIESFYAEMGKADIAISYLMSRSAVTPRIAAVHVSLGYAYYRKGDLENATSVMKKAIEIEPTYPLAHCGLGVILLAQDDETEAQKSFEHALMLNPDYPEAHLYLGVVYERTGKIAKSQEEFDKAYSLKPQLREVDLSGTLPIRGRKSKIPLLSLLPDEYQRNIDLRYRHIKLNLGVGITNIEEENWYSLTSHPEVDYQYFGAKVSLEFLMNGSGEFRETDLEYQKILQYIRVGNAGKPFYAMGGKINDYTLGYGSIVQSYMNQSDESNRKIGALLSVKSTLFSVDGMANNIEKPDVIGGRASLKLLQNIEGGFSYMIDNDPDGNEDTNDEAVSIYGGDVTLTVSPSEGFFLGALADVAKINGYGMGIMSGVLFLLQGEDVRSPQFNLFTAYVYSGAEYEPGFFNTFYERDKFSNSVNNLSKVELLSQLYPDPASGMYSRTSFSLPPVFDVGGTYSSIFGADSSGTLYLVGAFLPNTNLIARLGYYRTGISTAQDVFIFDENTYTEGLVGYWFTRFAAFMLNYSWTYVWDEEAGQYKTQQRVSPVLHISTQF